MFENFKQRRFEKQYQRFQEFSEYKTYLGTDEAYDNHVEVLRTSGSKNTFNQSDANSITTVVTCWQFLSNSVGRLPLNVFQKTDQGNQVDREDYRFGLLHNTPDGITSSFAFISSLEYHRARTGNSFALIHRDSYTGKANKLQFIHPKYVKKNYITSTGKLIYVLYKEDKTKEDGKREEYKVNSEDILHFKWTSGNPHWGVNPIEAQRLNLSTLWKSKNTVDSFYENNAFIPRVLKSVIPDAQFLKPFLEAMREWKAGGKNIGPSNAGTTASLPPFTEIQELGINPVDAMFIDSQKFDISQIAAFYGLSPDKVGVYDYSKYNNVEQAQLSFKVDTLSSILRMYRQEFEMKLLSQDEIANGKSIEFVTQAIMETDTDTRMAYYDMMLTKGMTMNQIMLLEGLPTFKGGDEHYRSSQIVDIKAKPSEEIKRGEEDI